MHRVVSTGVSSQEPRITCDGWRLHWSQQCCWKQGAATASCLEGQVTCSSHSGTGPTLTTILVQLSLSPLPLTPWPPPLCAGMVGDWKSHFTPEMNAEMDAWLEEKFGHTDLTFVYELPPLPEEGEPAAAEPI